MRKLVVLGVMIAGLIGSAVAFAATTHDVKSSAVLNGAGTKAKPAAFQGKFSYAATEADGSRTPVPLVWKWKWDGVQANGARFPKCTSEQIDAAQSDSVCPKGSLVAAGPLEAKLGPEGDKKQSITCLGKSVRIYNAGATKATLLLVGPADRCAGVAYLSPVTLTLKTVKGTTEWTFTLPENLTHPLPGIEGGITILVPAFKALKTKVGKKTYTYMSSTKCTGKRKFTFTVVDAVGTTVKKTTAGTCRK